MANDLRLDARNLKHVRDDLLPACMMTPFNRHDLETARTVYVDREATRFLLDRMMDGSPTPDGPEAATAGDLPVLIATALPLLTGIEGEYPGRFRRDDGRMAPKGYSADMAAFWIGADVQSGRVRTLGFGACPALRETARINLAMLKTGSPAAEPTLFDLDGDTRVMLADTLRGMSKARTTLSPLVRSGIPFGPNAARRDFASAHCPYLTSDAVGRAMSLGVGGERCVDRLLLAFAMTLHACLSAGVEPVDGVKLETETVNGTLLVSVASAYGEREGGAARAMHERPPEPWFTPRPEPQDEPSGLEADHGTGGEITGKVETITPRQAELMLERNTLNRRISERQVEQLVRAVRRGEWEVNGEAVKFAADGRLLDGQHRLRACVESGVPFRTLVIRGLPGDAQRTMDTGKKRTLGDVLELQGRRYSSSLPAIAKIIYVSQLLGVETACTSDLAPTRRELLDFIDATPELADVAKDAASFRQRAGRMIPPSAYGLLRWTTDVIDPELSAVFFDRLATGADLSAGDPILLLRNTLLDSSSRRAYNGSSTRRRTVALCIKAWNKWRVGATVRSLRFSDGEKFPHAI